MNGFKNIMTHSRRNDGVLAWLEVGLDKMCYKCFIICVSLTQNWRKMVDDRSEDGEDLQEHDALLIPFHFILPIIPGHERDEVLIISN